MKKQLIGIVQKEKRKKAGTMMEKNKINWKYVKTAAGFAGLFLAPFFSYVLFEFVTGNLMKIPANMALLNIFWIAMFYLLVFAISGSTKITMSVSMGIIYIL